MEPITLATRGYIGCSDITTALASRGYLCSTIVVDLPCRRVYTNIKGLTNLSHIEKIIYKSDLIEQLNTSKLKKVLDTSFVIQLLDSSNLEEQIVRANSYIEQVVNGTNVIQRYPCIISEELGVDVVRNNTFDTDLYLWSKVGSSNYAWEANSTMSFIALASQGGTIFTSNYVGPSQAAPRIFRLSIDVLTVGPGGLVIQVASHPQYPTGTAYYHNYMTTPATVTADIEVPGNVTYPYLRFTGGQIAVHYVDNVYLQEVVTVTSCPTDKTNITKQFDSSSVSPVADNTNVTQTTNKTLLKCKGE